MGRWVVCAVAQGRHDRRTLKVAAHVAERIGARLAIVTVLPVPPGGRDGSDLVRAGRCAVADLARRCAVVDDAVHCVEVGDPVEELARVSDELDAELVVVGATRVSALKSLLRPGVAARLNFRVRRAVAIVPARSTGVDAVATLAAGIADDCATRVGTPSRTRRSVAARWAPFARRSVILPG